MPVNQFPSLRWPQLERVLTRKPLGYRITHQVGSHRTLEADGRPDLLLTFHDKQEIPRGLVRKILVKDIGLTEGRRAKASVIVRHTMNAIFRVHIESGISEVVWWADTDAIPGFSAAADSLRELRALIDEAAAQHLDPDAVVALELIASVPEPDSQNEPAEIPEELLTLPPFVPESVRSQTIVTVP
ncbi:MAG: type II toxin-antitoxin system HicA family toxin [Chloroflexota bacterium]